MEQKTSFDLGYTETMNTFNGYRFSYLYGHPTNRLVINFQKPVDFSKITNLTKDIKCNFEIDLFSKFYKLMKNFPREWILTEKNGFTPKTEIEYHHFKNFMGKIDKYLGFDSFDLYYDKFFESDESKIGVFRSPVKLGEIIIDKKIKKINLDLESKSINLIHI